jgi:class 3 adenylate cyclase
MRLDSIGSQPSTLERTPRGTVLFADLRGYVGMAERLAPSYLATLLDEYFGVLTVAVEMHGGEVYHTAGDALMAGFGLSKVKSDGALAALRAGCEMLSSFATLAERWRGQSHIEAGMGVGLHLGELALATFGPPTRRVLTLVGDTPNVAARLCSRARAGEVLFSCAVAAALQARTLSDPEPRQSPDGSAFLQLPRYELRGRREPLDIWCIPARERATSVPGFELRAEGWQ